MSVRFFLSEKKLIFGLNMVEEEVMKERVARFKELIKQGYSIAKAREESKLGARRYKEKYEEIFNEKV
ncbi:MAG: hypothetical protein QW566_03330 [Candidatus Jordarchaeales archaeon]